jgi:ubiquinone/menaquinone biosynthesis C-methylase UbiE
MITLDISGTGYELFAQDGESHAQEDPAVVEAVVSGVQEMGSHRVLEIGAEAFDRLDALARMGLETLVADPDQQRLARLRQGRRFGAVCASALALPFRRASLDCAVLLDVSGDADDLDVIFRELRRVVRLGVVIDAVTRDNFESLWYRHYFPEIDSVLRMSYPALGTVVTATLRAGFVRSRARAVVRSSERWPAFEAARNRPELLFDERFRAAAPVFAAMGAAAMRAGLAALRCDLDSGRFNEVRAGFESRRAATGDCFVVTAYAD